MYATPAAAPPWIDDHDITYNELIKISGVNRNTAIMHQRTLIASGRRCGRKLRGLWFFSTREAYFFLIISALSHGKIPISLEILLGAWDFAQKQPDVPFCLSSRHATTTIDAASLWNSVIEMMTDVRAALAKAGVNV